MTKEETIINAIGLLPEEMVIQEETEELKKCAARLEKEEKKLIILQRSRSVLACVACLALIITIVSVISYIRKSPDNIRQDNIAGIPEISKSSQYTGTNNNKSTENKGKEINKTKDTKLFIMENSYKDTNNNTASFQEDNPVTDTIDNINLKEVLPSTLVKLQTFKEQETKEQETKEQTKSTAKKTTKPEYIVFSLNRDFYFTVSNYKKGSKTYITGKEDGKKRFLKGKRELCKAGDKVYFDISAAGTKKSCTGIPAWDKEDIEITAFAEIYMQKGKNQEMAGIFYIGKKYKNNKEGKIYYGIFKNSNKD